MDSSLIFSNALNPPVLIDLTAVFLKSDLEIPQQLRLEFYNVAAIAATYGSICASICAVTFVAASSFLSRMNVDFDGRAAALASITSPAIIVGLLLVRVFASRHDGKSPQDKFDWGEVLRESCLNSSVFLLVDRLLVGLVTSDSVFLFIFN